DFFKRENVCVCWPAVFLFWLDKTGPTLPAILTRRKIGTGAIVRVVKAQTSRIRRKGDAALPVSRDEGRALLGRAIDVCRDFLAMPMQLLRCIGVIKDVYRHLLPFFKAEKRSGKLTIVSSA